MRHSLDPFGHRRRFYETVLVPNPGTWHKIEYAAITDKDVYTELFDGVTAVNECDELGRVTLHLRFDPAT